MLCLSQFSQIKKKEAIILQQQKQKQNKTFKIANIVIIMMIWLWTTAISSVASESDANTNTDILTPTENQFFEMRATEIKEIEGKNRQVIFELWGYDIEFKRV